MDVVTKAPRKRRKLEEGDENEEEEGTDLISLLPDDALREIVTHLPSKDAARTQLISKRWLPIWSSAPLNLEFTESSCTSHSHQQDLVSRILTTHAGPGRRFVAPVPYSYVYKQDTWDRWFGFPALRDLQELEFNGYLLDPPPPCALRFSATLRIAVFSSCCFSDVAIIGSLSFPRLEHLTLRRVTISDGILQAMIAGCPVLKCLLLSDLLGCSRVLISSPTIRAVGVCDCYTIRWLDNLTIKDAPCLERSLVHQQHQSPGRRVHISIVAAPKLETLCCLTQNVSRLEIGTTVFQELHTASVTSLMRSVKILALDVPSLSLDKVIGLMRCFPCVEKLYIKTSNIGDNNVWRRKNPDPVECSALHLRKIVLSGYRGNKPHVDFAMFFVLNARVLKNMTFEYQFRADRNKEWIDRQKMRLMLDNRVSPDARFYFRRDDDRNKFRCIKHAPKLLIADPFANK